MKVVQVQFAPWDKAYNFSPNNIDLAKGDKVVVKTELGVELGEVVGFLDTDEEEYEKKQNNAGTGRDLSPEEAEDSREDGANTESAENHKHKALKPILRKATPLDMEKIPSAADKNKALEYCRQTKEKFGLAMKFIDMHYSFDGSRITFAFIADGRVDFRELVKDLTRHFGRTIRLQQIGIRDEAKFSGDIGHCGRQLCCRRFLSELSSITSEMAECQQCSHRGSERISGLCGRLMCCLAYEEAGYEKLTKNLPPLGSKVRIEGKRGTVVGYHVLKQTVDVEIETEKGERGTIVEMDLKGNKKN